MSSSAACLQSKNHRPATPLVSSVFLGTTFYLSLYLFQSFINVTFRIFGNPQNRLVAGETIGADRANQSCISPTMALLELLLKHCLRRGGKENQGSNCPQECVEVHARPDQYGARKAENQEWRDEEPECHLSSEEAQDVVYSLLGRRVSRQRIKEEWSDKTSEIYVRNKVSLIYS